MYVAGADTGTACVLGAEGPLICVFDVKFSATVFAIAPPPPFLLMLLLLLLLLLLMLLLKISILHSLRKTSL